MSIREWIAALFRNVGRATEGGRVHSVVMKVYDNGRLVCDREIDAYETHGGMADRLYLAGRMNSFTSELYGRLRKIEKESARMRRKGGC